MILIKFDFIGIFLCVRQALQLSYVVINPFFSHFSINRIFVAK